MVNYAADRLALLRLQNLRESLADVEEILYSLKGELEVRRQDGRSTRLSEQLIWEAEQERARLLGQISAAVDVPGIYRERRRRSDGEESFERVADSRTRVTQHFSKFYRSSEEFTREDHEPVGARGPLYREEDFEDDEPYYYSRPAESERPAPEFELSSGGKTVRPTRPTGSAETPSWMSVRVERKTRTHAPPVELRLGADAPPARSVSRPKPPPFSLARADAPTKKPTSRVKPAPLAWLSRTSEKPTARAPLFEPQELTAEDLPAIPEDDELLLQDDLLADLDLSDEELDLEDLDVGDLDLDELGDFDYDNLDLEGDDLLDLAELDADLLLDEDEAELVDEELGEPFLDGLDLDLDDDLELLPAVVDAQNDRAADIDDVEDLAPILDAEMDYDLGALNELEELEAEELNFEIGEEELDLGELADIDLDNLDFDDLALDELELLEPEPEMTEIVIEEPLEVGPLDGPLMEAVVEEPLEILEPVELEEPNAVEAPVELEEPIAVEAPVELEEPIAVEAPVEMEEPIAVEAPVECEEPIAVEAPVDMEEPIAVEAPVEFEEPIAVEAPVELEEPIAVEAPVELEEPIPVEAPVELEEPIAVEAPIELEEPIAVEAPVELEEPIAVELEEPIAVEAPAELEEPIAVEAPVELEEPITLDAPAELEEPIAVSAPAELEEPIAVEAPVELEEPIAVEAPVELEEPITVDAPAELEEPIAVEAPVELEEPIAVEAPAELEEPIAVEAPVELEDPIAVEAPVELEEPIAVEAPVELAGPADLFEGSDLPVTEHVIGEPVTESVSAELSGSDEDLFAVQPIDSGGDDFFASSEPLAVSDLPATSGEDLLVGSGESLEMGGDFFAGADPATTSWLDEPLAESPLAPVAPLEEAPTSPAGTDTSLEAAFEGVAAEEAISAPPPGAVEAPVAPTPSFDGGASAQERRRLVRLACSYDTSAYLEGRPVSVKLVDISLGGGKLQGPASNFQRGQLIQVSNPLPEARVKDPVTARIVWIRPSREEEGRFDIGLQFEESPEVLGKSWVITVLNKIGMQSKVFNQRKYTRAAANLPIEIDLKTKERHPGTALDIGLGGALLAVDRVLSPTTRFTLHMGPLGNHDKLELNCEVISSRHDEAGVGWTHSAKFAEISTTQTKLLGKYVVDLLKTGGSV